METGFPDSPGAFGVFFKSFLKLFLSFFSFLFFGGSLWGAFGTPVPRRKKCLRHFLAFAVGTFSGVLMHPRVGVHFFKWLFSHFFKKWPSATF